MKFPVDSYDLKARYAPALIISLPVLITLWTTFLPEMQSISKVVGGLLSTAILYFLSVLVRAYGKNFESNLWEMWGGAPSTQVVSWNNQRIGENLKKKYHECVRKYSNLTMPTKEDEKDDPEKAAAMIADAFRIVKGVIRKKDKDGLWSIANSEYGFARNLYGSRILWLILSIVSLIVSGFYLWVNYSNLVMIGFVLLILNVLGCGIFSWRILPVYTEQVAFRYAEHAWESYYNIADGKH